MIRTYLQLYIWSSEISKKAHSFADQALNSIKLVFLSHHRKPPDGFIMAIAVLVLAIVIKIAAMIQAIKRIIL